MRPLVCTCLLLFLASAATATTYLVDADETGDYPTIQAAIDACVGGDVVELADGTFIGDGNRDISYLGKAITIESQSGNAEACIIDCGGTLDEPHQGFVFDQGEGPDAVLRGVKITGGWAPAGGAVRVLGGASPTLEGCIFENNTAAVVGGAVSIFQASSTLRGCSFIQNHAIDPGADGGGVSVWDMSQASFEECLFRGNDCDDAAGGVFVGNSSDVSFSSCVFEDNVAHGSGGGLLSYDAPGNTSTVVVDDCIFEGNHADNYSGAISVANGSVLIVNRTEFYDNSANSFGGAVGVGYSGTATIDGCTFAGNSGRSTIVVGLNVADPSSATLTGCTFFGDLAWEGVFAQHSPIASTRIENTIVSFNFEGPAASGIGDFTLICCDVFGNAGGDYVGPIAGDLGVGGNISENPGFCHPADQDFTIVEYSACAADQSACGLIGAWPVGCLTVGIAGQSQSPMTRTLLQNHPNPFNPATTITYTLPAPSRVTLKIHDIAGRLVRVLQPAAAVASGQHDVVWDGRDDRGRAVGSGVYYYRIDAGEWSEVRSMVLVK